MNPLFWGVSRADFMECAGWLHCSYAKIPEDVRIREVALNAHNGKRMSSDHTVSRYRRESDDASFFRENFELVAAFGLWGNVLAFIGDSADTLRIDEQGNPDWNIVRGLQKFNRSLELSLFIFRKLFEFGWVKRDVSTGDVHFTELGQEKVTVYREAIAREERYMQAEYECQEFRRALGEPEWR